MPLLKTSCFLLVAAFVLWAEPSKEDFRADAAYSSCSHARGKVAIRSGGTTRSLSCFTPIISGRYASIGMGDGNVALTMNFLSRPHFHTCKSRAVTIDYHEGTTVWTSYAIGRWLFGDCRIQQTRSNGAWRGHATAELVIVKGDQAVGSPTRLHTEKDESGRPLSKAIEVDWYFENVSDASK